MRVNPAVCMPRVNPDAWREFRRSTVAGLLAASRERRDLYREPMAPGIYYIGGVNEDTAEIIVDTRIGAYTHPARRI